MKKYIIHEKMEFTNVRELVEWAGDKYGDKTAYSFSVSRGEIAKISFRQLRDDVRALACRLVEMGCTNRHCVLIGKPSYHWVLTYYAVLCAGGVLVPLDKDWTAPDLADTVATADGEFLFCDGDVADKAEYIAEQVSLSAPVVYLDGEEENFSDCIKAGYARLEADSQSGYQNVLIDPMKMSLLVFTSGTTGKGKGVMLSQNAILSCLSSLIPYIDFSDKTVSVLPFHHTYGSTVMIVGHTMIGAEVYISSGIRYIPKELKEQQPGHLILVPLYLETFYRKIWANIKSQGKEALVNRMIKVSNGLRLVGIDRRAQFFKSVRAAFGGEVKTIISGGAPINPQILEFFDAIGIGMLNGYGITECAPLIAANPSKNIVFGSVGNVIDVDTVRINEPNADGEGEIWVKGPNVMLGYYKNPEATAEAFEKGFFKTGDYGKLDREGNLYITGRKKNLIILSNGKNVYPEEIENELVAVPGVVDIIVYEGQSRRGLEHNAIVAEVYPDFDYFETNGIDDIESHLKKYVDDYNKTAVPYKKIGVLKVRRTEFPKNTLRKIQRFKLDMSID